MKFEIDTLPSLGRGVPLLVSAIGLEKSSAAPVSDGANLNRHLPNKAKTRMFMRPAVSRD